MKESTGMQLQAIKTMRDIATFHVSDKELPEIMDWKMDKPYTITMQVKMTELRKNDMLDVMMGMDEKKNGNKTEKGKWMARMEVVPGSIKL